MQELMATLREPEKKEDRKDEDEDDREETEQQAPDWDIKTPGAVYVCVCACV